MILKKKFSKATIIKLIIDQSEVSDDVHHLNKISVGDTYLNSPKFNYFSAFKFASNANISTSKWVV